MHAAIFGCIVADIIGEPVDLRNPPPPGGLHVVNSITLTTGGNVSNTSIAMAKLGMQVAAGGLVGNDVLGSAVVERLKQAGVDTSGIFPCDKSQTSASLVAVEPGGERVFFHTPGVIGLLDADSLIKCFPIFAKCQWVQIGYFGLLPTLTPRLAEVLPKLKTAAPNTKIALETVNPPAGWKLLEPVLPMLDLFAPSRTEAAALTGENDPAKMVGAFRQYMKTGLIGIKLDAEGCLLDDGKHRVIVPSYKIDVVDTTGAGDTWYAGLLTGLCKQMPLEMCGKLANRTAADCCTALGASAGVKSFDETIARI